MDAKLKRLSIATMISFGVFQLNPNGWANDLNQMQTIAKGYFPKEGFVPDGHTAVLVALAILTRIYGQQQISLEQPFMAELNRSVWTVKGSLRRDMAGGVAIIKLSKPDGRVLFVNHGK